MTLEEQIQESWSTLTNLLVKAHVSTDGQISKHTEMVPNFEDDTNPNPYYYELVEISNITFTFNDINSGEFNHILDTHFQTFADLLKSFLLTLKKTKIEKHLLISEYLRNLEWDIFPVFLTDETGEITHSKIQKIKDELSSISQFVGSKDWWTLQKKINSLIKLQHYFANNINRLLNDSKSSVEQLPNDSNNINVQRLSFTVDKTQLAMLFLCLRDCGILNRFVNDSQLAEFLESATEYDNNKEVKGMKVLISQILRGDKGSDTSFEKLKSTLDSIVKPCK